MALIRIIVPVYKTENCLARCVESILSQTEPRFELVLVDDGSPDGCPALCDQYAKADNRITVIHQENQGLSAARNAGLSLPSDHRYVTFIDSDDWVHPRYLEILLSAALQTGCAMSVCAHQKAAAPAPRMDMDLPSVSVYSPEECYCLRSISTTPTWGKLYRADLVQHLLFPVGKIHEDYYTTWKLLFRLDRVAVVERPLYFYYTNPQGIMHSPWSPRHMDLFPALEEKLYYFHAHGLNRAHARAACKITGMAEKYIKRAEETEFSLEYVPILREIQQKWAGSVTEHDR